MTGAAGSTAAHLTFVRDHGTDDWLWALITARPESRIEVEFMPRMDWEDFQRDHHRPHLLVVSVEATKASEPPAATADLERLAVRLEVVGNYAIKADGRTIYAAFEDNGDAERFAEVFRLEQITREAEWAWKATARMDSAASRRIAALLKRLRLTTKRRKFRPK